MAWVNGSDRDRWHSAAESIYGEDMRAVTAIGGGPRSDGEVGLTLEARWIEWSDGRQFSAGPDLVALYVSPNRASQQRRGITAAMVRHMERHLSALVRDLEKLALEDGESEVRQEVAEFMAREPSTPRQGGEIYYRALLSLWEPIEARAREEGWLPRALELVADGMQVNAETLRTRIRVARRQRNK